MKTEKKIKLLSKFYKKNGRLPKNNEYYKDVNIGKFVKKVTNYEISLSNEEIELLNKLGIKLSKNKTQLHNKVTLLIKFYNKFGRWPKVREVYKDINIGYFFYNIKLGKTTLLKHDKKRLKKLNFNFDKIPQKENTHNKVIILIEFYNKHNRWPNYCEIYKDIKLGIFFKNIISGNTSITDTDKKQLEILKFPFK